MAVEGAGAGLGAQLRGNARLRWGLWAIVGILWLYAALELRDRAAAEREAVEAASRNVARMQRLAAEKDWPARLGKAQALQQSLEARVWEAGTVGLAQAGFQDWLSQAVQRNGLAKPQLSVAAQEDTTHPGYGLWKATARLNFDFEVGTLYRFVAALAQHDKALTIEALAIRGAPPRVEMVLVAYYRRPATDAAPRSAATGAR